MPGNRAHGRKHVRILNAPFQQLFPYHFTARFFFAIFFFFHV